MVQVYNFQGLNEAVFNGKRQPVALFVLGESFRKSNLVSAASGLPRHIVAKNGTSVYSVIRKRRVGKGPWKEYSQDNYLALRWGVINGLSACDLIGSSRNP